MRTESGSHSMTLPMIRAPAPWVPPGHQGDLGAGHLVDGLAAQLFDGLAHVSHADDVGLREVAAVGVDRDPPRWVADAAPGHERTALADAAEAVVLQLHQDHRAEVVIEQG